MSLTPSESRCVLRVRQLVRQAIETRGFTFQEIGRRMGSPSRNPLYRALNGIVTLRTLLHIADALDYDVIIHFRDRRHA